MIAVCALGAFASLGGSARLAVVGPVNSQRPDDGTTTASAPALGSRWSAAGLAGLVRRVMGAADDAVDFLERGGVTVRLQLPNIEAPAGGHKTIVFFPGWLAGDENYVSLPRMFREQGFATAVVDMPARTETTIIQRTRDAEVAMNLVRKHGAQLDTENFVLMGHSMGGATSIGLSPTRTDVAATVALAPGWMLGSQGFMNAAAARPKSPLLVIGAEHDRVVPMKGFAKPIADACSSAGSCTFVIGRHMSHNNFADAPRVLMWAPKPTNPARLALSTLSSASPRVMSPFRQQRATVRIVLPWLRKRFAELGIEMPYVAELEL